jgi:hypothetical protein
MSLRLLLPPLSVRWSAIIMIDAKHMIAIECQMYLKKPGIGIRMYIHILFLVFVLSTAPSPSLKGFTLEL